MFLKSRSIAVILAAVVLSPLDSSAHETELTREIDFVKPFAYSLSLMSVGLPMLIGAGAFEDGPSVNNFTGAFKSAPEWENDSAFFNFVLHPLWGSETYLRAREANWGIPGSIAFSMGMSVTWEYLMESWVTHPSAQDLIFTTGIGWMIGELRYNIKNRTAGTWNWAVDPIDTTLQHLKVKVFRERNGATTTIYGMSWNF